MRKTSIWARAAASIFCAIAIVVAPFAPFAQAKSAQEIFAAVAAGVVVVFALDETGEQIGQGSGVVVGKNEVVTNCHVIANARDIIVGQAADSRGRQTYRMGALVAARDEERDLCLLFVGELSSLPAAIPAAGNARDLSIGEEIFAVGAPRGLDLSLTRGIVSQLRGDFGKESAPLIQINAAISPGSSGGGLFNKDGKLVGITTFKHSGDGNESLSFAMPAEWVAELQAQAAAQQIAIAEWVAELQALAITTKQKRQKCLSSPTVDCLFEIALRTAEKIEYAGNRASALRYITVAQAEVGHRVDAKNTFSNALRTTEKIKDAFNRASALRDIAVAQAEAGHGVDAKNTFSNALQTAEKIEYAGNRTSALRDIAVAQAEAGHGVDAKNTFSNALRTAEKIEYAGNRASALRYIAVAQAEAGHSVDAKNTLSNALQTAEKIEVVGNRASALHDIAVTFAEEGLFPNALQIAEKIEYVSSRESTLRDIAVAQAESGDIKNAIETSAKIGNENHFARALARIAVALAKTR